MALIYNDMVMDAALNASAALTLYSQAESWYFAAWNSMEEQAQAEMVAEWEQTIAERAEEISKMRAEAGLDGAAAEKDEEDAEEGAEEEGEDAEEGKDEEGEEEGEDEE